MADTQFTPTQRTKSYADLVARFWAKVGPPDENGCRPWLGISRHEDGYGRFNVTKWRAVHAHAFAWRVTYHGPTRPGGEVFRHSCDNPWCCEPSHSYPGTPADNMADRDTRGRTARGDRSGLRVHPERAARGERNASAKLTAEQVLAIRAAHGTQIAIAKQFGVSQPTVSRIRLRAKKGWDWLDGSHS